jgi:hypothetical protein
MDDARYHELRETFAGIVQGGCEASGGPDCDPNECPCDRVVENLIAALDRIDEERAAKSPVPECPVAAIEKAAGDGFDWLMAQGRVKLGEPPYGVALMRKNDPKAEFAYTGEGKTLAEAIDALRFHVINDLQGVRR